MNVSNIVAEMDTASYQTLVDRRYEDMDKEEYLITQELDKLKQLIDNYPTALTYAEFCERVRRYPAVPRRTYKEM